MDIGEKTVSVANAKLNGVLKMTLTNITANSSDYTGGQLNVENTLTLGEGAKLQLTVENGLLDAGQTTKGLALINAGTVNGDWGDVFEQNLRYAVIMNDDGLVQIKSIADVSDLSMNRNNTATGVAFDDGEFAADSDLHALQGALNELSQHDLDGYQRALSGVAPADTQIVFSDVNEVMNIINHWIERNDSILGLGHNGGDVPHNGRVFVDLIGSRLRQGATHEHMGFNANMSGVMLGINNQINPHTRIGFGYAYHNTDADSGVRDTDITGHTVFGFAKYQPGRLYMRAMASYGIAGYSETSDVVGIKIKSDYDVDAITGEGFMGVEIPYLMPEIGARYTHISRDAYRDSVGQKIKFDDTDTVTMLANLRHQSDFDVWGVRLLPALYVGGLYDVVSDDTAATVSLGNTGYMINGARLERMGLNAGGSFILECANWDFGIGYNFSARHRYIEHSASINIRYNF